VAGLAASVAATAARSAASVPAGAEAALRAWERAGGHRAREVQHAPHGVGSDRRSPEPWLRWPRSRRPVSCRRGERAFAWLSGGWPMSWPVVNLRRYQRVPPIATVAGAGGYKRRYSGLLASLEACRIRTTTRSAMTLRSTTRNCRRSGTRHPMVALARTVAPGVVCSCVAIWHRKRRTQESCC
jgi:hypothetical protein